MQIYAVYSGPSGLRAGNYFRLIMILIMIQGQGFKLRVAHLHGRRIAQRGASATAAGAVVAALLPAAADPGSWRGLKGAL